MTASRGLPPLAQNTLRNGTYGLLS